ncbi:MAG: hypothetical protein MAG453_00278 [Calditrichaeota bacterium]|nr:hypothetical protein [Calditrichota bacterium]
MTGFHLTRVLCSLLLAGALTGCGLFETRDPAEPVGSQASAELALSPAEALDQLATACALHDPTLYMAAISDGFQYSATQSAFPDDPAFFEEWGSDEEDNFVRSLLAPSLLPPDSLAELTFEPVDEVAWADSALFRENYRLEIHPADTSLPSVYEGLADFTLRREQDGGWRVVRWLDDAAGDAPAISELRAAL